MSSDYNLDDSLESQFFESSAYMRGYEDLEHGVPKRNNPYTEGTKDAADWVSGYRAAAKFWFSNELA